MQLDVCIYVCTKRSDRRTKQTADNVRVHTENRDLCTGIIAGDTFSSTHVARILSCVLHGMAFSTGVGYFASWLSTCERCFVVVVVQVNDIWYSAVPGDEVTKVAAKDGLRREWEARFRTTTNEADKV